MKLHVDNQHFEGIVPANRIPFKIATNAKLFGILSDGIYKDKILAVIRELSCNAHDVHVETKNAKPFRVYLPNRLEPTFAVEDEGTGIDPARISEIYWTYGESSKTKSNDTIGALGLGSKSPFAYTKSSFVVKNRWKGNEHTYFCFINETGVPDGSEISVTPTDKPDGITVELAARDEDIHAFHDRVRSFFKYWERKPEFVGEDIVVPTPEKVFTGTDWYYEKRDSYNSNGLAVMGNVPYPIDISSIPSPSANLRFVATNSFVLTFPLGTLSFQASREELSYEKVTIEALEKAAKVVFKELKASIAAEVVKGVSTPLELLRRFKGMSHAIENRMRNTHVLQAPIMHFFEKKDQFVLPSGETFTAEELSRVRVSLDVPGSSPLGVFIGNGYSSAGRWTLKQARKVTLKQVTTKPDPKDATKTVPVEVTKVVPWFRPSTKPLATPNVQAICTMLAHGFTPVTTSLDIEVNGYGHLNFDDDISEKDVVRFIINNHGAKGAQGFRTYAKNHGFSTSKTFFIEADPNAKIADFGKAEVETLIKGTLFQGAEVTYLSDLPDFELPKADPKDANPSGPRVTHARGTTEVRMLTLTPLEDDRHHNHSTSTTILGESHHAPFLTERASYQRIQVAGCGMLYVVSHKGSYDGFDKELLSNNSKSLMAWLYQGGCFDDYKETDGTLRIIARKAEDIEALIKKGAQIKRLSEVVTTYLKRPEISDAYKTVSEAQSISVDSDLDDLVRADNRKLILPALAGHNTFFEQVVTRADQLIAALKTTKKALIADYALAQCRPVNIEKLPNVKHTDKDEMLKRYPLISMFNDIRYSRNYLYGQALENLAKERAKHVAMYIIAADQAFNAELAAKLADKKVA